MLLLTVMNVKSKLKRNSSDNDVNIFICDTNIKQIYQQDLKLVGQTGGRP